MGFILLPLKIFPNVNLMQFIWGISGWSYTWDEKKKSGIIWSMTTYIRELEIRVRERERESLVYQRDYIALCLSDHLKECRYNCPIKVCVYL